MLVSMKIENVFGKNAIKIFFEDDRKVSTSKKR
jgi:hypothetical protein